MIFIAANYVVSIRRFCIKVAVVGNSFYVTCPYPKWDCKETWLYIHMSLELCEMEEEIERIRNKWKYEGLNLV
jgi:hypothetical protein